MSQCQFHQLTLVGVSLLYLTLLENWLLQRRKWRKIILSTGVTPGRVKNLLATHSSFYFVLLMICFNTTVKYDTTTRWSAMTFDRRPWPLSHWASTSVYSTVRMMQRVARVHLQQHDTREFRERAVAPPHCPLHRVSALSWNSLEPVGWLGLGLFIFSGPGKFLKTEGGLESFGIWCKRSMKGLEFRYFIIIVATKKNCSLYLGLTPNNSSIQYRTLQFFCHWIAALPNYCHAVRTFNVK